MSTTYKKKLIEVAIPLEAINEASIKEKSNPFLKGHPRSLHQWWARRPLPACRAVLFAQLVDDPSSDPERFPTLEDQEIERNRLFAIIENLVKWENSTNEELLEQARIEIRRSCGGRMPKIYDPFSGGGAIPFEAQRLNLPSYGADLNPVAVMIGKAMIEIPPKFKDISPVHSGPKERQFYRNAEGLAEDVKYYGEWVRRRACERIGHIYPQFNLPQAYGGGAATVIAYIWARTVPSPDPAFSHVQVPLVRSFELSSKKGQRAWVDIIVQGDKYHFEVRSERSGQNGKMRAGNVGRQGAVCLISDAAIPFSYIREKAKSGKMGQVLMAVVVDGPKGRIYVSPDDLTQAFAFSEKPDSRPDTLISHWPGRTNVVEYGMDTFGSLFTDRQLITLNTLSEIIIEARERILHDACLSEFKSDNIHLRDGGCGADAYAEAVSVYLTFALDKMSDYCNSLCSWNPINQNITHLFTKHAIPMLWDFAEINPFGTMIDFEKLCISCVSGLATAPCFGDGKLFHLDAGEDYPVEGDLVISTDPPYYDNIEYADISDFFYVWMRKSLKEVYPSEFGSIATPKSTELVANPYRHGGKRPAEDFFLEGMTRALARMASRQDNNFPATIYYAFKQSEIGTEGVSSTGWATFLGAVIQSGFSIVGTWPLRTERSARMIASGNNALASSVVLVCRKREGGAESVTRAEFIRALQRELPSAIKELQAANIAPADMPQSAIGPGMGVFSRYRAVLESDDSPMSVKTALQLINRELDDYLGGIQGEFDADTRFAITWFEQNGLRAGDYGTANNIATARGISVESVKHAGIVESQAGKVRVLQRDELDDKWEPGTDQHLTIWECLQHLVRLHEKDGISHATAVLLKKIGDKAEAVKDLAYILYDISANKRQDAKEATAYNALIADWTELSRQAASNLDTRGNLQQRLEF